jgi:hypothetical protein
MKRLLRRLLLIFFMVGTSSSCAWLYKGLDFLPSLQAQGLEAKAAEVFNPAKKLSQFPIEYWTSEKGLPTGKYFRCSRRFAP